VDAVDVRFSDPSGTNRGSESVQTLNSGSPAAHLDG